MGKWVKMTRAKCAIGTLILLLVTGIAGIAVAAPERPATPAWEQANSSGFGDSQTSEVTALAAFGDYLYAGTYHPTDPQQTIDGAQIFRSSDGITWTAVTDPGFGNSHDTAPPAILDLTVFNGYLYASTGRGNAAQIWRSSTGNEFSWARVINAGFGDPDIVDITVMAEYKSQIYVGVTKQDSEAQIWRSFTGDGTLSNWTQVVTGTEPASVSALTVYDGALYAAVEFESGAPVQIWRSYGGEWTTVVSDGFGDADTIFAGGMAEFGGYLYVGAGNSVDGAQLWRSNDGTTWTQVITPGFGDGNNQQVEAVFVFQNELYASTQNGVTGMELWRSADGATWEQANADGFGDANNSGSNWSNASAAYLGELYMGTVNAVDGGELWRMQQPYGVALSGDDALAGAPGETVTYTLTITNNGSVADSFDLTAAGQTWTSTLSAAVLNLAAGAGTTFTVDVAIPPGAADQASDGVTITVTSQGDSSKTDSALLTTTSVVAPVYGVALSGDEGLAGAPGQTVTYTLTITNNGSMADSFDLTAAGQSWTSTLSAAVLNLAPAASTTFTVDVAIPPEAADQATDGVTITATSQGDSSKTDSALLTTTSVVAPVYGVALSGDDALAGAPGQTVTYTLTITNSGNVADSFDLTASGAESGARRSRLLW